MKSKIVFVSAILLILSSRSSAQWSGYLSGSYGYHDDPLYNYQKSPDQLKQTYLELAYAKEYPNAQLTLRYVSGLMIFNSFAERNFYEHTLHAAYLFRYLDSRSEVGRKLLPLENPNGAVQDTTSDDEESEIDSSMASDTTQVSDSTDVEEGGQEESEEESLDVKSLKLGAQVSARYDKSAYTDFDNQGFELSVIYSQPVGGAFFVRLSNNFDYRGYPNVSLLSNVTDALALRFRRGREHDTQFGLDLTGALKFYTESSYDTTRFETQRTFVPKGQGKGKPGANLLVPSEKRILVQPRANGTYQLASEVFVERAWQSGSFNASVLYQWNVQSAVRYLAQTSSASFLTEDIYNDVFSFEGPEARLKVKHEVIFGIKAIWEGQVQRKFFHAPALNVIGEQIAAQRIDLRSSLDLNLSRYAELYGNFGLDVSLDCGVTRNRSNDDYNDYSFFTVSLTVGISF